MKPFTLPTTSAAKDFAPRNATRLRQEPGQDFEALFATSDTGQEPALEKPQERKRAQAEHEEPGLVDGRGLAANPLDAPSPAPPAFVENAGRRGMDEALVQPEGTGGGEATLSNAVLEGPSPTGEPQECGASKPIPEPTPAPSATIKTWDLKEQRLGDAAPATAEISDSRGEADLVPEHDPAPSTRQAAIPAGGEPGAAEQHTTDGTAVAQQEAAMDLAQEQNENAGQEQNLPGSGVAEKQGPTAANDKKDAGRFSVPDSVTNPLGPNRGAELSTVEQSELAADVPRRIDLLQHIESSIESASSRLQNSNEHSVSIVLRPLPGTELLMNVRVVEGRIEAAVEIQQGDAAKLGSDWLQLQQRLERQGVHLSDLTQSRNFGGGSRHQREQTRPESGDSPGLFAPPLRAGSSRRLCKPAVHPVTHFESWA